MRKTSRGNGETNIPLEQRVPSRDMRKFPFLKLDIRHGPINEIILIHCYQR